MKVLWIALALLLAGCAGPAEEPTDGNGKFDAATAVSIYDEHRGELGVHEVLGLIAHKGAMQLPWTIGNNPFGESSGDLENGRASSWNLLLYQRESQQLQWHTVTSEGLTAVEQHPASALGWNLEYNDAEGYGAGRSMALHGGHTCEFMTKFSGIGNSTKFDASTLVYLPQMSTHGDDCARDKPMGFTSIPASAWIADRAFIDNNGNSLDARMPAARLNEAVAVDGTLPANPLFPVSHTFTFQSEASGDLQVHARLIAGPELYNDGTITLESPEGTTWTVTGDLAEWDLSGDDIVEGEWTLTLSWELAQPLATFQLAAQVVQIA